MAQQDHGFMYGWSFHDVDGNRLTVFWTSGLRREGSPRSRSRHTLAARDILVA
jgi:hypothetical protein